MTMRACEFFDKYRDGELSLTERSQFEAHLAVCSDCQTKKLLIDNIVCVLKQDETQVPSGLAERITERVFTSERSWNALIISWLRPGPALASLALIFALFSLLVIPNYRQVNISFSDYESLMDQADAYDLSSNILQTHNDSELMNWLEQEEFSK
jgi:hypothetical protein